MQVFPISWQKLCRKELHASPHDLNFSSLVIFQINYIESYLHDMIGLTNPSHMLGVIPHLFERRYSTSIYCRFPSQALQYWREIKSFWESCPKTNHNFLEFLAMRINFTQLLAPRSPSSPFGGESSGTHSLAEAKSGHFKQHVKQHKALGSMGGTVFEMTTLQSAFLELALKPPGNGLIDLREILQDATHVLYVTLCTIKWRAWWCRFPIWNIPLVND